jgi:hypothetical protein
MFKNMEDNIWNDSEFVRIDVNFLDNISTINNF